MVDKGFVKIGDQIFLYAEVADGYLASTGLNHPNFYVQKSGTLKPALVPNTRNMVFQIYPKFNYNVARDYDKLRSKFSGMNSSMGNNKQLWHQYQEKLTVLE